MVSEHKRKGILPELLQKAENNISKQGGKTLRGKKETNANLQSVTAQLSTL